jgi:hypothetical protein
MDDYTILRSQVLLGFTYAKYKQFRRNKDEAPNPNGLN